MTTWESVDEENLYDSPPFRSWNILGERMDHFTDENYRPWMSARTIRNSLLPQWNDSDCSNVNFRQLIAPSLFLPLRPRMNVSPWSWAETGEVEIHLVIRLIGSCERFEWGVGCIVTDFTFSDVNQMRGARHVVWRHARWFTARIVDLDHGWKN